MPKPCCIYVITPSPSGSGERVAHSVARQFPDVEIPVESFQCESDDDDLEPLVQEAAAHDAVILNTLVQSHAIARLEAMAKSHGLPCISLFPPFADCMRQVADQEPKEIPGLYSMSSEQVYQLSRAMRFAVAHDDSARPEEWHLADAVLLGIAGTGKTTLAVFLANLGYKVATCTISPGKPPPPQLSQVDNRRIFGISLPYEDLLRHRQRRQRVQSPLSPELQSAFVEAEDIQKEVDYSEKLFADMGITVIKRHTNSMECSVSEVVYQLSRRFQSDQMQAQGAGGIPMRYHPQVNSFNDSFRSTSLRRSTSISCRPVTLYVVTTGFGYAGEMSATVFAAQWPEVRLKVEVMSHIRQDNLSTAVDTIARCHRAIMLHTLIPHELRDEANRLAAEKGIPCVDLFGDLINCLCKKLDMRPTEELCSYHKSPDKYFKTCNAVEYALDHDDGANPEDWPQADVLVLGVSRVGKSPLSIFLSTYGLKVANCPLCPGIEPPPELDLVDRRRTFGLVIDPEVLVHFREERQQRLVQHGPVNDYSSLERVYEECEEVKAFLKKRRITTLNVTGLPVPAIAAKLLQRLGERLADFEMDSLAHMKKYFPLA